MSTEAPEVGSSASKSDWLDLALGGVASLMLLSMMGLTFVDVLGRYLLNAPVPGAFEVTEILMASLIFAGLPLVTRSGEHVSVNLFIQRLSPRALRTQQILTSLTMAAVLVVMTWRVWVKAEEMAEYGDETAYLLIPLAPVGYLSATLIGISAALAVLQAWRILRRSFS